MSPPSSLLRSVGGLGLLGALSGLALAWTHRPPSELSERRPSPEDLSVPGGPLWEADSLDRSPDPIELAYREGTSRTMMMAVEQVIGGRSSRSSDVSNRLQIEARVTRRTDGETIVRRYHPEKVRAHLSRAARSMTRASMQPLESSLRRRTWSYQTDSLGYPPSESERAREASRTIWLDRIVGAISLLTPRLRTGAVLPGEAWHYAWPLRADTHQSERGPLSVDFTSGELEVTVEYKGLWSHGDTRSAVLRMAVTLSARRASETSERAPSRQYHTSGRGYVLFDVDSGAVRAGWLTLTGRTTHATTSRRHHRQQIRLYLGTADHARTHGWMQ